MGAEDMDIEYPPLH